MTGNGENASLYYSLSPCSYNSAVNEVRLYVWKDGPNNTQQEEADSE